MWNTILAEANQASPDRCFQRAQWYGPTSRGGHPCFNSLCAFDDPSDRRPSEDDRAPATEILIANPRLEFSLTHGQTSHLRISNRKYIAIFTLSPVTPPGLSTGQTHGRLPLCRNARLVWPLRRLIYGSAIRNHDKPSRICNLQNSNRQHKRVLEIVDHGLLCAGDRTPALAIPTCFSASKRA